MLNHVYNSQIIYIRCNQIVYVRPYSSNTTIGFYFVT